MNNRTQVPAPSRTAPRRPAGTDPAPAGSLAAPGAVHNLREWPAVASERLGAPEPLAPAASAAAPVPRRLPEPSRPTDAWRDVLLNTLIPVVGLCAIALGGLSLAAILV